MSSPLGASPSNSNTLGLPRGELLGRYSTYLDAQKVVDYLADNDFPVSHLTIVGSDLKSVERVTAKLSYPKVALAGAAQGAMFGIFVGLVLTIFSPGANPLAQILSSVGIGMAIWMLVGVVSYSFRRGKRDFASQSQVLATNYDVVVAFSHAHAARALAAKLHSRPPQHPPRRPPQRQLLPPRYRRPRPPEAIRICPTDAHNLAFASRMSDPRWWQSRRPSPQRTRRPTP